MPSEGRFLKLTEHFLEQTKRFAKISEQYDRTVDAFRKDLREGVKALNNIRDEIRGFKDALGELLATYGTIGKDIVESKCYLKDIRDLMKKRT